MPADQILVNSSGATKIDTQTVDTDKHRQVIGVGDPTTRASVASVLSTVPASNALGITTRVVGVPAAAALADGMANPTTLIFGADTLVWNGTTWDRLKSILGAAYVNLRASDGSEIAFPSTVGATISANADGASNTRDQDAVVARGEKWAGDGWDRDVTFQDVTLRAAATISTITSGDSGEQTNRGHKGILIYIETSGAITGTGTPELYIGLQYKSPSGAWHNIMNNFSAEYAPADGQLSKLWALYPAPLIGHANSQQSILSRKWRVNWQTTGTTISVPNFFIGATLLP